MNKVDSVFGLKELNCFQGPAGNQDISGALGMASDTSHSARRNRSYHFAPEPPALLKALKSGSGLTTLPASQAPHC